MSRSNEALEYSGELQVLSGLSARAPSYGEDDEKTTFLARTPMGRVMPPRPITDESTSADEPRSRNFDPDERTVIAPMAMPKSRAAAAASAKRTMTPAKATPSPARSTPAPPWSTQPKSQPKPARREPVAPKPPVHVEEIREQTFVAPRPVQQLREHTQYAAPKPTPRPIPAPVLSQPATPTSWVRAEPLLDMRHAAPPPAPREEPKVQVERTDTIRPVAVDSTPALVRDAAPSIPSYAPTAQRAPTFFVAASIGMVAGIFALGIALGAVAFGRARAPEGTASAATMARTSIAAAVAPKIEAPKPVEAPKPIEAPKADAAKVAEAPKADAPKSDAPKADEKTSDAPKADAPKAELAKADAPKSDEKKSDAPKPKRHHATHAAAAVASDDDAPAPAPKPLVAKRAKGAAGAPSDDLDAANAADALARAQLEASLR